MKKITLISYVLLAGCLLLTGGCKDDALNSEAEIIISFKVTNEAGKVYNGVIGSDNTITLKVSPYLDAAVELAAATPSFFLSRGATVTPDPSEVQDFAQAGGVKYTVTAEDGSTKREYTVTWGISDKLPAGSGFSYAEIGTKKSFPELGYPGMVQGYDHGYSPIEYGDLMMYHAYCGNYIVLLSRAYVFANPASPHCIKVVDKTTLASAGVSLNLGSITIANLKMISSDYKGHCVGVVVSGSSTEFFYWTTPTAAPVSVGSIGVNMAPFSTESDMSSNFQVAGDITANAWITAYAAHNPNGEHYRIKVTGGQLASNYSTVRTGYSSGDCTWFQMISPLDDSDSPNFVIGDTEGSGNTANSIKGYVNSYAGSTIAVMPGLWQNILQAWWVGTGFATARTGGHRPVVSGMVINGKSYIAVTSGSAWWHAAAVLESDMKTLAHENLNITAGSISCGWSYGSWADWYWDEEESAGYLAFWFGRLGLYTYKLTCYE
ncbi:MAG: DUF5018 domain-containing protein [Prevotellaceae bacterium]|jgi:hypothetical protein|nr:DUF5018 domain-containing protein [Prevotellaceae bacterium]